MSAMTKAVFLGKILPLAFAIQSGKYSAHVLKAKSIISAKYVMQRKHCRSKKVKLVGIWAVIVVKSFWEK